MLLNETNFGQQLKSSTREAEKTLGLNKFMSFNILF